MSLLSEAMETCHMLDRQTVADGYGGYRQQYTEGVLFQAAIVFDTSIEARIAGKQGVTSRYTVTTPRTLVLEYHDVFRRDRDSKIFRVTSDGDDKYPPAAEEWVLPSGSWAEVGT